MDKRPDIQVLCPDMSKLMAVLRWCAVLEFLELAVKVGNIVETALFRNRSNGAFGIF
jgi:hypothetical protein